MATPLPFIAPRAWEHPADRAALNTLRAIPGLAEVVRKVAGFVTDGGIRSLLLNDAVLVGAEKRADLHALLGEVCTTLDCLERPDLYVRPSSRAYAWAVGVERPFIIVSSAMLDRLGGDDERRFLLAHEVGHIMSGHMTYHTIAVVLFGVGAGVFPSTLGVALLPFALALLEWHRKSEFSSDRAALLGTQDATAAHRSLMRLSGDAGVETASSVDDFIAQAKSYGEGGDEWDRVVRSIRSALLLEPAQLARARELERWRTSGQYDAIIAGGYARRGEKGQGLCDDYREAARSYTKGEHAMSSMGDAFGRARDAFRDAFNGTAAPGGPPPEPSAPI